MKKILNSIIILILSISILFIFFLSTTGIETNKFNNLIIKKIKENKADIDLNLNTIKFKIDIKEISLFLEAKDPSINFKEIILPISNIKVYVNFLSLIKSENKFEKISLDFNKINIETIKEISSISKPSNLTSFINNKLLEGTLDTKIEIYFNKDNKLDNFIAKGSFDNTKINFKEDINFVDTSFTFFADNSDIIIKNLSSKFGPIKINNGDVKIQLSSDILLETNFETNIKFDKKSRKKLKFLNNLSDFESIDELDAKFNNSLFINLDETNKIKKFSFKNSGKIANAKYNLQNSVKKFIYKKKLEYVKLKDAEINTFFDPNQRKINLKGKYSLVSNNYLNFSAENIINQESLKLKIDANFDEKIEIDLINYKKPDNTVAEISIDFEKRKDDLNFKKINFEEGNNIISINNLRIKKGKFSNLKKISVKTFNKNKKNNNFVISYGKSIEIKGDKFDASNLPKILSQKNSEKNLKNINKNIEINISEVIAPLSEKLINFRLIGKIEKGKFVKISSKGDFGSDNFLDITMKNDIQKQKKYLEIYSDITKPLLTEYDFFRGLTGGKLLYSAIIDEDSTNSKLKIENFKVINAPGLVKLLSLADLRGLADLAEGDGISFEVLEINMEQKNGITKINEILALGPSISVLMDGYQDKNVTSLRGTLVPAKTLNKMISRIPLIGDIVIPKEVGEGLFGISFKMKGPKGKNKTSINPIRTLTPRFIQKIVDRNKNTK
ncbi:MAG: hypothetical protein VXW12_01500 [Pseudomonadota bacterium]|nr:hypothetical protein [Pseudomonadota bacterium]